MNAIQDLRRIGVGFLFLGIAMLFGFALSPGSAWLFGAANLALLGLVLWLLGLAAATTLQRVDRS